MSSIKNLKHMINLKSNELYVRKLLGIHDEYGLFKETIKKALNKAAEDQKKWRKYILEWIVGVLKESKEHKEYLKQVYFSTIWLSRLLEEPCEIHKLKEFKKELEKHVEEFHKNIEEEQNKHLHTELNLELFEGCYSDLSKVLEKSRQDDASDKSFRTDER